MLFVVETLVGEEEEDEEEDEALLLLALLLLLLLLASPFHFKMAFISSSWRGTSDLLFHANMYFLWHTHSQSGKQITTSSKHAHNSTTE